MKIRNTILSLCTLFAVAAFTSCGNSTPVNNNVNGVTGTTTGTVTTTKDALSISPSVTFGQPQMGGGGCVGKGLCKSFAPGAAAAPDAIPVNMAISSDKKTLTLTFSKAELASKQSAQVPYFTDGGSYIFTASCPLTDAMYAPLGLLPNPRIDQASASHVTISASGTITDVITYSHD